MEIDGRCKPPAWPAHRRSDWMAPPLGDGCRF